MTRLTSENDLLNAALLNPEIEGFAMFDIDLSQVMDTQTGEPTFPEFRGRYTPLWTITSNGGREADRARDRAKADAVAHAQRVQAYIQQVEDGLGVFEVPTEDPPEEPEDTPKDDWNTFWCGNPPTKRGYVSRAKIRF